MSSKPSRTFVIIVNYDSAELVQACVSSFTEDPLLRFVVIDNASPSADQRAALDALAQSEPRMTSIFSDQNLGFGGAVNTAVSASEASAQDRIWILNPDTELCDGAEDSLRLALDRNPGSIISPIIRYAHQPSEVWFQGGTFDRQRGVTRHSIDPGATCTFLSGASLLMDVGTWDSLGGFREDLFMYWEDADLCGRAVAANVPLVIAPEAEILHHVGATTSTDGMKSLIWYRFMARNRLIVCADSVWRAIDLTVGRGLIPTARLFWRAIKEPGRTAPRFAGLLSGIREGFVAVSQWNPADS
ncbi:MULTISPECIES: glycosyltransferase family 2 protein [unclassified Microbacterium]|uniref:glycosyltransferase family 2 protein n=1 Tax=unclassified Microbacterium TaxID=2609290 RepID=UPI003870068E